MSDDVSRRNLLRACAASAAGLGTIGTAAAEAGTAAPEVRRIPCLDLTGVEDRTTTISATEPVPEQATGIRPGSQMFMEFPDGTVAGCTANFIWRDPGETTGPGGRASENADEVGIEDSENGSTGDDTYSIGAAGHCFLPEGTDASENARRDGESDDDVFDVTRVTVKVCADCTVGGATGLNGFGGEAYELGEVAYARQALPDGTQVGHDFDIVEIPEGPCDAVDPSLPQFGGPTGVEDGAVPEGETVRQYGAGVGNGEVFPTMASRGVSEGNLGFENRWYAGIRATPGDSGSPLEEYQPPAGTDAAGVLTHLSAFGTAGTTIPRCIEMPKEDGFDLDLEVVRGDEDVN